LQVAHSWLDPSSKYPVSHGHCDELIVRCAVELQLAQIVGPVEQRRQLYWHNWHSPTPVFKIYPELQSQV